MTASCGDQSHAWHFLQTRAWSRFKTEFGWQGHVIPTPACGDVRALSRSLPGKTLMVYLPYAPGPVQDSETTRATAAAIPQAEAHVIDGLAHLGKTVARLVEEERAGKVAVVRFDLPFEANETGLPPWPVCRAPVDVQPPSTVVIDLCADEELLLQQMHKKNRYNTRLAFRKGVEVREAAGHEIDRWYRLYQETARRDRIAIHSLHYYRRLFAVARDFGHPRVRLYLAEHQSDLLAGIIVVQYRDVATYLYGASSNLKRNLMPNYALQWHAMQAAKGDGCHWYDLFGVPPGADPNHPMYGLYRFKTGFGGTLVTRMGSWDLPVRRLRYAGLTTAERFRDLYFHRWKKRFQRA